MRSDCCPGKGSTAEHPEVWRSCLYSLVMFVLRVPLPLPEELCPQLSNCLSTLSTFCSSPEPHCNQFVHPNLLQPLWKAESRPSQHHSSNLRFLGQCPGFQVLQQSQNNTCSCRWGN